MRCLALAAALLFTGCAATNPADSPITLGQALYLIREERAQREAFDKQVAQAFENMRKAAQKQQATSVAPVDSKGAAK